MGNKILLLLIIVTIGLNCNHSRYQRINSPITLKFQVLKTKSNEPIKNGKAFFTSWEMLCSHCAAKIIKSDSVEIDENGFFEFSEKIFEYGRGDLSIKNEDGTFDRFTCMSRMGYDRANRKLRVVNYTNGFEHVIGHVIYDLKSNNVTHLNRKDTIESNYERIKIYQSSTAAKYKNESFFKILESESDENSIIEKIWELTVFEVKEAHHKHLETLLEWRWQSLINTLFQKKRDLNAESFLKIADSTDDLNKQYYFIVGAAKVFSLMGEYRMDLNPLLSDKIFKQMSAFEKQNKDWVIEKNKEFRTEGDCHPMQKTRGEMLGWIEMQVTNQRPKTIYSECCKRGK